MSSLRGWWRRKTRPKKVGECWNCDSSGEINANIAPYLWVLRGDKLQQGARKSVQVRL